MRRNKKSRQLHKPIEDGQILKRSIVKNTTILSSVLCWRIKRYEKLKNQVIYYQMYENSNFSCVFKLIKTKRFLYLALRCRIANRPSLFYLSNGEFESSICVSNEIVGGLYVGQFPQPIVCSPIGDLHKTGLLTLLFSFEPDNSLLFIRENEYSKVGAISDIDLLCHDISQMYLNGLNSDFVIKGIGISFKVHKYILLVRSEFFREFFRSANHPSEFTVKANAGILHMVLLYCYCGELPRVERDCLMTILEVAKDLKIFSLIERCQRDLICDSIWKDNIKSSEISSQAPMTEVKDTLDTSSV